jgi:hypothetical protein
MDEDAGLVNRVQAALTADGTLDALLETDPELLILFGKQAFQPDPKIPEALMKLPTVQKVKEDYKAQNIALLHWVAGRHEADGEIGRRARRFAMDQRQEKCDDGVRQFLRFLRSRLPGATRLADLHRLEQELKDGAFELANAARLEEQVWQLSDRWTQLEDSLAGYGKQSSWSLPEVIMAWLRRGIKSGGPVRSDAAAGAYLELQNAQPEEGREFQRDVFDRALKRFVARYDEPVARREVVGSGVPSKAQGTKKISFEETRLAARAASGDDEPRPFCEACQELGHFVIHCEVFKLVPGKDNVVSTVRCYTCDHFGHRSTKCPDSAEVDAEKRKNGGGPRKAAANAAPVAGRNL